MNDMVDKKKEIEWSWVLQTSGQDHTWNLSKKIYTTKILDQIFYTLKKHA